jgi:hypothetical protein
LDLLVVEPVVLFEWFVVVCVDERGVDTCGVDTCGVDTCGVTCTDAKPTFIVDKTLTVSNKLFIIPVPFVLYVYNRNTIVIHRQQEKRNISTALR